jgi:hypothetical protein
MISWNGEGRSCAGTRSKSIAVPESARFGRIRGCLDGIVAVDMSEGLRVIGEGHLWIVRACCLGRDGRWVATSLALGNCGSALLDNSRSPLPDDFLSRLPGGECEMTLENDFVELN